MKSWSTRPDWLSGRGEAPRIRMTLIPTGTVQEGMESALWLRPGRRRNQALRGCKTPALAQMSMCRSGIGSAMKSLNRSRILGLLLCMMSVLSRVGKFQRRTRSALPIPLSLCSVRGWLASRRSARKNPGTLPVGRGIAKIAAHHLRNTLVRLRCSLPAPAGKRMFPVGIAAGSPIPVMGRGIRVRLGNTRLLPTGSGTFLLRRGSVVPKRSR